MAVSTTEFKELQLKVSELNQDINDRGEEGIKARLYTLESVVPRMESRMNQFMHDIKELLEKKPEKEEPKVEKKRNYFMERILPPLMVSVLSPIILLGLFIAAVEASPVIDQMISHALGK